MEVSDFRSFMMEKIREFDRWAWVDARDNPEDYVEYQKIDWWNTFLEFMENEFD